MKIVVTMLQSVCEFISIIILVTPTGAERNKLADLNISILELIEKCKQ